MAESGWILALLVQEMAPLLVHPWPGSRVKKSHVGTDSQLGQLLHHQPKAQGTGQKLLKGQV